MQNLKKGKLTSLFSPYFFLVTSSSSKCDHVIILDIRHTPRKNLYNATGRHRLRHTHAQLAVSFYFTFEQLHNSTFSPFVSGW